MIRRCWYYCRYHRSIFSLSSAGVIFCSISLVSLLCLLSLFFMFLGSLCIWYSSGQFLLVWYICSGSWNSAVVGKVSLSRLSGKCVWEGCQEGVIVSEEMIRKVLRLCSSFRCYCQGGMFRSSSVGFSRSVIYVLLLLVLLGQLVFGNSLRSGCLGLFSMFLLLVRVHFSGEAVDNMDALSSHDIVASLVLISSIQSAGAISVSILASDCLVILLVLFWCRSISLLLLVMFLGQVSYMRRAR